VKNARVPSGQAGVSLYLCGVGVAVFGQLFYARRYLLTPIVLRGGIPDVLLRFTNGIECANGLSIVESAEEVLSSMTTTDHVVHTH
jgi:hypothetical protein